MPAPGGRSKQCIVDRKQNAEQRPIIRLSGHGNIDTDERPHARREGEREITQVSDEEVVQDLLRIVGSVLVPKRVDRRQKSERCRNQRVPVTRRQSFAESGKSFSGGSIRILCAWNRNDIRSLGLCSY